MAATLTPIEQGTGALVLHLSPIIKKFSEQEFFDFCMLNFRDSRIELTRDADLIIMPPTGGKTGIRNFKLIGKFATWVEKDGTGKGFDSSTSFSLPNGAKRSPGMAWVRNERWDALSEEEQERFPPLCPDFVMELRSRSDSLRLAREEMDEYVENGAQLGWLIDPKKKRVYVYRPHAAVEILDDPPTLSGEPLLRGFSLDGRALWE